MLDLGWQELFLISLVAIIVVGPKDLPVLIRSITKWFRTVKSIVWTFQDSLEEIARETELQKFRDNPEYFIEKSDGQVSPNKTDDPANRNILPDN
ncbi:MAG: twin-arginine translocase subunit TatB [Rhodospirillaceae bacterium]|mgnify:CR=1 FL=1|nr:twin-arginine translocase subunit TatB [Rhodospirillaceae bacterium]|tara:strand:+ start:993 stop:1277 length:285 start_codon:yes stop_codon:yes gene_type:complete